MPRILRVHYGLALVGPSLLIQCIHVDFTRNFSVVYSRLNNLNNLINVKNPLLGYLLCSMDYMCAPFDLELESDLWYV